MNRTTPSRRLATLAAFSLLAGCASAPSPSPALHDLGPVDYAAGARSTIRIDAPAWLWDDRLRYRLLYRDAGEVRFYHLARWTAPLPALLADYLSLEAPPGRQLFVALEQAEQHFSAPGAAYVRLGLRVRLSAAPDLSPAAERRFSRQLATATPDAAGAAGAIAAYRQLAGELAREIQVWLTQQAAELAANSR